MTNNDIYMLLKRGASDDSSRWIILNCYSRARLAFDAIKSGSIKHDLGDMFTIVSVDNASDVNEKARFLWISNGVNIVHSPQTHTFMGDKTWLQFWDGTEASPENMFVACSSIERKIISKAISECAKISTPYISSDNIVWAKKSIEAMDHKIDVDGLISEGIDILMNADAAEYQYIYSIVKAMNTLTSAYPHYEAHVSAMNTLLAFKERDDIRLEMASIIRSHIPLHRLLLSAMKMS